MITFNCDKCKGVVQDNMQVECVDCSRKHYHVDCVNKDKKEDYYAYHRKYYCDEHFRQREAKKETEQVITSYAEDFWKSVGLETTNAGDRALRIDLFGKRLDINVEPVFAEDNETLAAIKHKVKGLVKNDRERVFEVAIHSHDEGIKQIKQSLLGSLRSQKSALTATYNQQLKYRQEELDGYSTKLKELDEMMQKVSQK
jgi:hypothetical protein